MLFCFFCFDNRQWYFWRIKDSIKSDYSLCHCEHDLDQNKFISNGDVSMIVQLNKLSSPHLPFPSRISLYSICFVGSSFWWFCSYIKLFLNIFSHGRLCLSLFYRLTGWLLASFTHSSDIICFTGLLLRPPFLRCRLTLYMKFHLFVLLPLRWLRITTAQNKMRAHYLWKRGLCARNRFFLLIARITDTTGICRIAHRCCRIAL